ncbi:MAG TPA: hypothetical protein PKA80_07720 [Ignavibacteriaceae bacterium]|nr:hypothetical protein [Ignavibacteriaceae bacterium]
MKRDRNKKARAKNHKKEMILLFPEWETVDNYSIEEIEDLIDENHIPELSMIELIEKPKELIFD